jgi:hypothetical protein
MITELHVSLNEWDTRGEASSGSQRVQVSLVPWLGKEALTMAHAGGSRCTRKHRAWLG